METLDIAPSKRLRETSGPTTLVMDAVADGEFLRRVGSDVKSAPGTIYSSPLTTKGDIYTRSASADARLAVGAEGLLLFVRGAAATGLAWSDLTGDVRVKGKFASNVGTNGVGFIVDRIGTGRQSGYEWWQDGAIVWAAGLDYLSTDLVLACDVQPLTSQVHDLIRIKAGVGAIKITYGIDAVPNSAYRFHILASGLDDAATKQLLRLECIADGVNCKIPLYIKNGQDSFMTMWESAGGNVYRWSISEPGGGVNFVCMGPSTTDGSGGDPTLYEWHSDGQFVLTDASTLTKIGMKISSDVLKWTVVGGSDVIKLSASLFNPLVDTKFSGKVGFFDGAPVAQQAVDAVTNSVADDGTHATFPDFTNGTTYATDYPNLHKAVSQMARSIAQLAVMSRNLSLAA